MTLLKARPHMVLFRVGCPHCKTYFSVAIGELNKERECPHCENVFFINTFKYGNMEMGFKEEIDE